jgi:hypothetical protein
MQDCELLFMWYTHDSLKTFFWVLKFIIILNVIGQNYM